MQAILGGKQLLHEGDVRHMSRVQEHGQLLCHSALGEIQAGSRTVALQVLQLCPRPAQQWGLLKG